MNSMNYKKVIAYNPDTSVLFELEDGTFALVSLDTDDRFLITVSKYAETHLKFGGFEDSKDIPEKTLEKAAQILKKGEKVFTCRDLKLK